MGTTPTCRLILGDARKALRELPEESIHCCVCSPPYWSLRDYGIPPSAWGGDPACSHAWGAERPTTKIRPRPDHSGNDFLDTRGNQKGSRAAAGLRRHGAFCLGCGAWFGALGLEPTPELWVEHVVEVFRDVRRVLRRDGTLWLNLGDSFYGEKSFEGNLASTDGVFDRRRSRLGILSGLRTPGRHPTIKRGDLVGQAWSAALALRDDGWYLRMDHVWAKGLSFCPDRSGSVMPDSAPRATKSHEYLFLLTRSRRYFYDRHAASEASACADEARWGDGQNGHGGGEPHEGSTRRFGAEPKRRNLRSVWVINPQPSPLAHYASYPEALVEPCILAGTSERGVCGSCGAPWTRKVSARYVTSALHGPGSKVLRDGSPRRDVGRPRLDRIAATAGWTPSCRCPLVDPVPATVLDPFLGRGTTAIVAVRLGRNAVGIDLKPEYLDMARQGLALDAKGLRPVRQKPPEPLPLFDSLPAKEET